MTTLTPRQDQLCQLLCSGKTAAEAAAELGMKYNTMRHHVRNIRKVYGVHSLAEIVTAYSAGFATYRYVHRGGRKRAAWLTPAELEIFQCIARKPDMPWTEVCTTLGKARTTISKQTKKAYKKLGVRGRNSALLELGLLRQDPSVQELSEPFDDCELDPRTLPYSGYETVAATEE